LTNSEAFFNGKSDTIIITLQEKLNLKVIIEFHILGKYFKLSDKNIRILTNN